MLLCQKCVKRLRRAHDFKKQSEESDKHLRSLVLELKNKLRPPKQKYIKEELESSDEMDGLNNGLSDNDSLSSNDGEAVKRLSTVEQGVFKVEVESGKDQVPNEREVAMESLQDQYIVADPLCQIEELLNDSRPKQNDSTQENYSDSVWAPFGHSLSASFF